MWLHCLPNIFLVQQRTLRMKRPPTKPERKKEKEKKVIMTAPQVTIVILRTNSLFFCVGVCAKGIKG